MPDWLLVVCGLVLVLVTVSEVFRDLFQPAEGGAVSDWVGRTLFRLLRRRATWLPYAGPLTVVAVIALWVVLLSTGFALFYYAGLPEAFTNSQGGPPTGGKRFSSALYLSLDLLVTLGYSDLLPQPPIRFLCDLEGLLGFGILTASVSSIIMIFSALARMRVVALSVKHAVEAEERTGVPVSRSGSDAVLAALARDASYLRIDLIHFPIVYYFAARSREASVPYWLGDLIRLAADSADPGQPAHVRVAAQMLDQALSDFAMVAARRMHMGKDLDRTTIFRHLAEQHLVEPRIPLI